MTPRQSEVFAFIRQRIEQVGVSPKLEEIAQRFGFSNPRACHVVAALVEEGALIRKHRGAQGLALPGHVDLATVPTDALRAELARRGVTLDALAMPKPFFDQARACAANFCTTHVKPGQLMCRDHWFKLPPNFRSAILNAWGARQVQAFQEAVEAARDFLGGYTRVVERVG